MIGPTWRSRAVQTLLGPNRSQLVPAVLWTGWLDASGDLVAMTGLPISHEALGPAGEGIANIQAVDCGVAGAGWVISAVGLFDAADGSLIVSAAFTEPISPAEGDALSFPVGALTFTAA